MDTKKLMQMLQAILSQGHGQNATNPSDTDQPKKGRGRPRKEAGDEGGGHVSRKPKKEIIVQNYLQAMRNLDYEAPSGHTFHKKYLVLCDGGEGKIALEVLPGDVLKYRTWDDVTDEVIVCGEKSPTIALMPNEAHKVMQMFRATGPVIKADEIAVVRQKDEPGYCWHRLDFNFEQGECPTFDEILGRMTNARAFQAYIGSIFDVESDKQQYLWLYGEGKNGKSSIGRILDKILGSAYRAEVVPSKGDRFWTSGLLGSRLVCFSDCTEYHFPKSGLFKSLTGADPVRMERKGQQPITTKLQTKFMFFSNETPDLKGDVADMRRAIYCEIGPLPDDTVTLTEKAYTAKLWSEVSAFLFKCWHVYQEETNQGQLLIPTELDSIKAIVSTSAAAMRDESFEMICDGLFTQSDNSADFVLPKEIHALIFDNQKWGYTDKRYFYQYLRKKWGAAQVKRYVDGKKRAVWVNIAWQDSVKNDNMRLMDNRKNLCLIREDINV